MKTYDFEQGSDDWLKIRCGLPTASNFNKIVTTTGSPSKQMQKYLYKTAGEAITLMPEETYQSAAMLRGVEMEAEARSLYEVITGTKVDEVGFCVHESGVGCSPDGLVGEDGMVEIKNPLVATHVGYLLDNKLPTEYFIQTQGQLFVTGRKWCDFISYSPGLRPLIVRVERDEKFIQSLRIELELFNAELKEIINQIK